MSLIPPALGFLFDLGGPPPPSYFLEQRILLILSLGVLPLGYALICVRMIQIAIPRPPIIPYFCAFGSLGGYCLLAAFSPSFVTLLVVPFAPIALLSLIASVIYVLRDSPRTVYHRGAAISCFALLLLFLLVGMFGG